jgi:2-polyprenyl-6-methoxyphenol hydroxylase-like FAD-dependent oxidoreductase
MRLDENTIKEDPREKLKALRAEFAQRAIDAAALAKVLSLREGKEYWRGVGDKFLMRRYERERKAGLLPTWLACDGLQRLFSHPHTLTQSMRNWGMSQFDKLSHLKQWTVQQAMHPSI